MRDVSGQVLDSSRGIGMTGEGRGCVAKDRVSLGRGAADSSRGIGMGREGLWILGEDSGRQGHGPRQQTPETLYGCGQTKLSEYGPDVGLV